MPKWDSDRPHVVQDWDQAYEELKQASTPYLSSGRLGWDDRLKMFFFSGPVDPHGVQYAHAYMSYNQCRLALLMGPNGNQPSQHVIPPQQHEQPRPSPQPAVPQPQPVQQPIGGGPSTWH